MDPCMHCGRVWMVRGQLAGKKARCRECQNRLEIPPIDSFKSLWRKQRVATPECHVSLARKGFVGFDDLYDVALLDTGVGGIQFTITIPMSLKDVFQLNRIRCKLPGVRTPLEQSLGLRCQVVWFRTLSPKVTRVGASFQNPGEIQTAAVVRFLKEMRRHLYPELYPSDPRAAPATQASASPASPL